MWAPTPDPGIPSPTKGSGVLHVGANSPSFDPVPNEQNMLNNLLLAALLAFAALTSCGHSVSAKVTTTTSNGVTRTEAVIYGEGAKVSVAGDALEIREGQLWVNGKSNGAVEGRQVVRYVVNGDLRELTVDDSVRKVEGG